MTYYNTHSCFTQGKVVTVEDYLRLFPLTEFDARADGIWAYTGNVWFSIAYAA